MPRASKPSKLRESSRSRYRVSHSGRLLLDTHAFLWFDSGDPQLSPAAKRVIEEPSNTIFVSAASVWEIAIKRSLGKLPDRANFAPTLSAYLHTHGFTELPITGVHAERAGALIRYNRDPFDRMLIAQAGAEELVLVSNDQRFDAYGVRRLW